MICCDYLGFWIWDVGQVVLQRLFLLINIGVLGKINRNAKAIKCYIITRSFQIDSQFKIFFDRQGTITNSSQPPLFVNYNWYVVSMEMALRES
jgi:hypothetical protein